MFWHHVLIFKTFFLGPLEGNEILENSTLSAQVNNKYTGREGLAMWQFITTVEYSFSLWKSVSVQCLPKFLRKQGCDNTSSCIWVPARVPESTRPELSLLWWLELIAKSKKAADEAEGSGRWFIFFSVVLQLSPWGAGGKESLPICRTHWPCF